jgi:non-homologous end joining protein Ku
MVSLASHILESKAAKFDPGKFKDEYETALGELVQRKARGHTIETTKPAAKPSNVITLMDALRESLKEAPRRRAGKRPIEDAPPYEGLGPGAVGRPRSLALEPAPER